ncbi:MAG: hypothetical protein K0R69_308 [Clostridia bacterium]|nr:hypothetical protein [Clostridia bacterium]
MKKQMKAILTVLVAISIIACLVVGYFRINAESDYKNVQIAVRYTDILNIAEQTQTDIRDILKEFKDLGVTTLFVRENTVLPAVRGELSNYKEQGEVTVFEGYMVKAFYKDITGIKPQLNYIVTKNQSISDTIYKELSLKNIPVKYFIFDEDYFIEIGDFSNALSTIGVGFNEEDLNIAADLGYVISPQVRGWVEPSEESIAYLIETLKDIKGLGAIYFSDAEIPGASSNSLIDFIGEHQLGFVEFFSNKQKGFNTLAKKSSSLGKDFRVMRLHTVTDEEVKKYGPAEMLDRYGLALKERNLRTFLFKMSNTMNMKKDISDLRINIENFKQMAEDEGYQVTGDMQNYNLMTGNYVLSVLAGVGAISVFILLFDFLGLTKLGYILGIIGAVGYAGLLKVSPSLGLRLMALFGAIIFPTYAVSTVLDDVPRNMKQTLAAFLKICLISFGGALTIIGTISRTSFGLGIDVFPGVKIAHIIPIMLVLGISIYKKHGLDIIYYKKILTSKVTYLAVGIIGIVGVALLIYTMRTGNNAGVSAIELQFRQLLDNILGVRPRTKEFLIAYPILVSLLYFGYKEKYLPLLIFAAIGPVSLVNTYAHIHTPVSISLIRSAYGIGIGFILGVIVIKGLKLLCKVIKKWEIQKR